MARLGRFDIVVQDENGSASSGTTVELLKQGASVQGDQSGTSPKTFTVEDPGALASGDAVFIFRTDTTVVDTATVNSAPSATAVELAGFSGTLALLDDDRITASDNQPTIYVDALGTETLSATGQMSSDTDGQVKAYVQGGYYDFRVVTGGTPSLTTKLYEDVFIPAEDMKSRAFDGSTQDGWILDTAALTSTAAIISFRNNGTEEARIEDDGSFWTDSGLFTSDVASGGNAFVLDADATFSAGDLLRITNNGTEKLSVDFDGDITSVTGTWHSEVANSGSNDAFILNSTNTMSGTTQLLSVQNNGTEKFSVEDDGKSTFAEAMTITAGGLTVTAGGAVVTAGGLTVGSSGINITDILEGSKTFDAPSVSDGGFTSTTVTVTGAVVGNYAIAAFGVDVQNLTITAAVSAADTVEVSIQNNSGSVVDLASTTLRCVVFKT